MIENLEINGQLVPHTIFNITKDGACLFRAISYLMYGRQTKMRRVRELIVQHVVSNWPRFKVQTHDGRGNNHRNANLYLIDMMKNDTYGSHCELLAAGEIFEFLFEVYRDGKILMTYGINENPVKRLRFTGLLDDGHFDAYTLKGVCSSEVVNNLVNDEIVAINTLVDNEASNEVMKEKNREENNEQSVTNSTSKNIFNLVFGCPKMINNDKLPTQLDVLLEMFFQFNQSSTELKTLYMFSENVIRSVLTIWGKTMIPIISQAGMRMKVSF